MITLKLPAKDIDTIKQALNKQIFFETQIALDLQVRPTISEDTRRILNDIKEQYLEQIKIQSIRVSWNNLNKLNHGNNSVMKITLEDGRKRVVEAPVLTERRLS